MYKEVSTFGLLVATLFLNLKKNKKEVFLGFLSFTNKKKHCKSPPPLLRLFLTINVEIHPTTKVISFLSTFIVKKDTYN